MTSSAYLLFLPACFALNMAFGPNNLLSVTHGARHGVRVAVLAASGRLVAFALMIAIAGIEADAALTVMYDQSPAEVFEYVMDVNGIHCTTNNNAGCNTVAGCGGTFV